MILLLTVLRRIDQVLEPTKDQVLATYKRYKDRFDTFVMARHRVYSAIVAAVRSGDLVEPFTQKDFRHACPGFGEGTYQAFLHKHRRGNPGGYTELFERVSPGRFKLLRPVLYGL